MLQFLHFVDIIVDMTLDLENFEEIRTKGEEFYKTITDSHCPYFKEKVFFNAQGLEHLKFKKLRKARSEQDQYMRFKLVHLAPEIIKLSNTLQGKWETKQFEYVKNNSRWEHVMKNVIYYEFIAVLKRNRVKVIVKQVESGKKIFWSIIPFWGMNEETVERVLHDGKPSED